MACSKKAEPEKANAPAPSASVVDPNADGKRLERSLTDWKRRWDRIKLESCESLLKEPAELELCTKTQAALAKVKELAAKTDKSNDAIRAAGELVLAAENAVEKLRASAALDVAGAGSAKPPAPRPMGSMKPAAPKAAKPGAPAASGSAAVAARQEDPKMKLVSSYERVARTAARYLGSFLQQGTLDTRKSAFAEVQRLVPQRERWSALRDVVRQASLTEREPDLRKQLREMETKLRAMRPAPAGSAPVRPSLRTPGMPKMPKPGTAPAPAPAPAPQKTPQ